jgi:hypothetical protein
MVDELILPDCTDVVGTFCKTDNWPSKSLKIIFSKLKQELNIELIKIGMREYYRWELCSPK